MKTFYIRHLLFLFLLFFSTPHLAFATSPKEPVLSAQGAVVMDAKSGEVFYSKNPHSKFQPASTTKLMTALVALDRLKLSDRVLVSRNAANTAPSRAGLVVGVEYKMGDLLAAILIASSNDAAVALAEAIGETEEGFANIMNQKAEILGMTNTFFVNASGLPDKKRRRQYTTAHDLALLIKTASRDPRIDHLMGIRKTLIQGSDGKEILLTSHNKMLWRTPKYVKGKTGWTFKAKHTFAGTNYSPNKLITFALLYSEEVWTDIEKLAAAGLEVIRQRQTAP